MITVNPDALSWKFDSEPGISTREGILTEWPAALGAFPTQVQADLWAAEYEEFLTRQTLIETFIAEGVARIAVQVPEWDSLERVRLLASIFNMLGPPNAAQTLARDIFLYVRDTALPKIATVTTQAGLDAIDPPAADPFGDGTPWPN